jgi:hypothetical protein
VSELGSITSVLSFTRALLTFSAENVDIVVATRPNLRRSAYHFFAFARHCLPVTAIDALTSARDDRKRPHASIHTRLHACAIDYVVASDGTAV